MSAQGPSEEKLSADVARRVLERASELEAAHNVEMSVAELREVAREAGIPSSAFEQALTELRAGAQPAVAENTSVARGKPILFWAAAVPGLVIGGLTVIFLLMRLLDL